MKSGRLDLDGSFGRSIRCFNFGIDASSSVSVEALTRILVEDFQPRILIVGTDARDYAVAREDRDIAVVLATPWVRYRMGEFTLEGWLLDHSYLFRHRRHLSQLARFNTDGFCSVRCSSTTCNIIRRMSLST